MNLRGGWSLIKNSWSMWMQYRSFFFVLAFGWMIPPLIYMFVWCSAAGSGELSSFSRGTLVAYYLLLILVNQLTYSQSNWTVGDMIRMGDLNAWLLRPLLPLFHTLASEVAGKVVCLVFTVPVTLLLALIFKPEFQASDSAALLFLPALLLTWLLRFIWGYWLALLAFWYTRADALLAVQDSLVFLLGGIVAPLALLPEGMQAAAVLLPFRYMLSFPVEMLTSSLSAQDISNGLLIQSGWCVFSVLLTAVVWKRGLKQYTAVGG